MSDDAKFEELLEKFIPTPPDATPYKHGWRDEEERAAGYQGIEEHKRLEAFVAIRETLEDAGVPFLRATGLAERCLAALLSKGAL